jgi:GNAT superfamily N-acetyltransferase
VNEEYLIRSAIRADLHHLPSIERAAVRRFGEVGLLEAYAQTYISAEEFEARQRAGLLKVAALRAGDPVGFATWTTRGDVAHLEEMDVHPQHGRRGLGARLLASVCRWAASREIVAITLSTTRGLPWNELFYSRHGFHELPESAYTADIRELRAAESAAGLPLARRLIMLRELRAGPASRLRRFLVAKPRSRVV